MAYLANDVHSILIRDFQIGSGLANAGGDLHLRALGSALPSGRTTGSSQRCTAASLPSGETPIAHIVTVLWYGTAGNCISVVIASRRSLIRGAVDNEKPGQSEARLVRCRVFGGAGRGEECVGNGNGGNFILFQS